MASALEAGAGSSLTSAGASSGGRRWWAVAALMALLFTREIGRFTRRRAFASPNVAVARRDAGQGGQEGQGQESPDAPRTEAVAGPTEFSASGWKQVLVRTYEGVSEHRLVSIAAGVTFYLLLAIFPAIAALVSIYGLFADPSTISRNVEALSNVLPGGAVEVVGDQINRIAGQGHGSLSFAFALGLVISLWSANSGVKAMFDALNVAYGEEERRGFIKLNVVSLTFTILGIVFLLGALGAVVAIPIALQSLQLQSVTGWLVSALRWPALFVAVALALAFLYRFGPDRRDAHWRWITWGSASATLLWLAASALFSWYAANFGSYNKTYGSLGAVIGFMTWIWLSTIIVLLGAELDSDMERTAGARRKG
jgi:membrane protein